MRYTAAFAVIAVVAGDVDAMDCAHGVWQDADTEGVSLPSRPFALRFMECPTPRSPDTLAVIVNCSDADMCVDDNNAIAGTNEMLIVRSFASGGIINETTCPRVASGGLALFRDTTGSSSPANFHVGGFFSNDVHHFAGFRRRAEALEFAYLRMEVGANRRVRIAWGTGGHWASKRVKVANFVTNEQAI